MARVIPKPGANRSKPGILSIKQKNAQNLDGLCFDRSPPSDEVVVL